MSRAEGLFHWSSRDLLWRFVVLWAPLALLFVTVYAGADFLTSLHSLRLHLYVEAELAVPLMPAMVLPYMSVYLSMGLAPFVLRTNAELDALAIALATVIVIAGLAFLLLPAELGFAPVSESLPQTPTGMDGIFVQIMRLADRLNLEYNAIPSLHVALLVTCLGSYFSHARTGARLAFLAWIGLVSASTMLTHQHHLIDVTTGLVLGVWGARLALDRAGHLIRSNDGYRTR